jgi:uncharacterized protein YndB with AHSA1/START domain
VSGAIATAGTDIAAAPERVWEALTSPEEISDWMFGSQVETTWDVGSPITWTGEYDGRTYQDKGEVLMGDEDVPESYHTLVYTLTATDNGTRLELSQDGCDSDEQAAQFSQNWQAMLDRLRAHIDDARAR